MSPLRRTMWMATAPKSARAPVHRSRTCKHVRFLACVVALLFLLPSVTDAKRRKRKRRKPRKADAVATVKETKAKSGGKNQVFDFTGLNLGASMRTPQLLYFLDRASEELHRASLERRSFVPEMVRSISEEGL